MSIPEHARSVELDVLFCHCDPLRVVWHGRYLEYMEAARTALLRSLSLDATDVEGLGYMMFVTDARVRYMSPLRYGERVRCTAWFSAPSPVIRIAYRLDEVSSGRRIARAYTAIATTGPDGKLIPSTPDRIIERIPHAR